MVDHLKEAFIILAVLAIVAGFMGCEQVGEAFRKPVTYQPAEIKVIDCKDSDGMDLFTKGTVKYDSYAIQDCCSGSTGCVDKAQNVVEGYCKAGKYTSAIYKCENGCEDGACVKEVAAPIKVEEKKVAKIVVPANETTMGVEDKAKYKCYDKVVDVMKEGDDQYYDMFYDEKIRIILDNINEPLSGQTYTTFIYHPTGPAGPKPYVLTEGQCKEVEKSEERTMKLCLDGFREHDHVKYADFRVEICGYFI